MCPAGDERLPPHAGLPIPWRRVLLRLPLLQGDPFPAPRDGADGKGGLQSSLFATALHPS